MKVGALRLFRDFRRRRIPGWLVVLLLLIWLGQEYQPMPAGEEWIEAEDRIETAERTADVGMTLERELGDRAAVLEWILAVDDGPRAREWLLDELARGDLERETASDDIVRALDGAAATEVDEDLLASLVASGRSPTRRQWTRISEEYAGIDLWEWEAQALERLRNRREPGWVGPALDERAETRREIVLWSVVATAATVLMALAGLPFLPAALKSLAGGPPPPRLMRWWPVGWVLFSFLLVDLSIDLGYQWLYSIGGAFGSWPFALDVAFDAAWRIGGTLALLWMMLPGIGHARRVLGFDRRAGWRATLGMLSLLLIATNLWYRQALEWFPEDSGLDLWEDGHAGLFYSILSGVILAPVCEEIVFRGLLFGGLWSRLGFWPAALLSSLVFALVHHYGVAGTVGVFAIGLAGCALFRRTGSLTGPIVLHAAYNALITLAIWPVYHGPYS